MTFIYIMYKINSAYLQPKQQFNILTVEINGYKIISTINEIHYVKTFCAINGPKSKRVDERSKLLASNSSKQST